jgi:hypothetical protein
MTRANAVGDADEHPHRQFCCSARSFAIAAKLYLLPMLPRLEPRSVVTPILLLPAMRHLGLMFLASGAVFPGLPERFAKLRGLCSCG